MDLFSKESSCYLNEETAESKPLVLMTYGYEKEKINGRKIVNGNFEIIDKVGEGSFWTVYKVERSVINESINHSSFHVFKEGKLSLLSTEDEIIEENEMHEDIHYKNNSNKFDNEGKNIFNVGESNYNKINSLEMNDLETLYSDENIKNDQRLGLKELYILRRIDHKNIARLYECIIDESLDKIVFVMEYCELGQLMNYNCDETGYEYNKKLIIFLLQKFVLENFFNQRKIIIDITNFKKDESLKLTENEIIQKLKDLKENIKEENENGKYLFDFFDSNFKLKVFFCKIFLNQIIKAIKYLHSKNICNGDIKPENIVFKNTFDSEILEKDELDFYSEKEIDFDFVKITDFSISKIYENKNKKIISFAGSDLFKAPEMLNFEYFNPFKAEIYSIGVTIIYFLFKKFYKSKSIKQWNVQEKNTILENVSYDDQKNEFGRCNSKFKTIRSNSFLNRPRKSSIIYNNFEKMINKECFSNFEDTKTLFEDNDEIEFYHYLNSFIADNPEDRLDIEKSLKFDN